MTGIWLDKDDSMESAEAEVRTAIAAEQFDTSTTEKICTAAPYHDGRCDPGCCIETIKECRPTAERNYREVVLKAKRWRSWLVMEGSFVI